VYEVKPLEDLRADWKLFRPRFKAAVKYCRERGWRFKIVTEREIRTPFVENAKFLRRYRNLPQQSMFGDQMLYTLKALGETTPQALLAAAYLYEEKRMAALPELWRLIACRQVGALLDEPLTMQSSIWLMDAAS
jgi:TnsA endonuclease C terminal